MSSYSPIFIVGYPRSGTTLLAGLLDRHSEVAIPPETSFFFPHVQQELKISLNQGQLKEGGVLQWVIQSMGLDHQLLWKDFLDAQPCALSKFLEIILTAYTQKQGKKYSGEKSPWHLRYVPNILATFPTAKVICIVRDGRDAVLSIEKTPFGQHRSRETHCLDWNRAARLCRRWNRLYSKRFIWMRYEDLLSHPEETLTKLCKFINIPYEVNQLDVNQGVNVYREHEFWVKKASQPIDQRRAFAWKKTLSDQELHLMNILMASELSRYNYPDINLPDTPKSAKLFSPLLRQSILIKYLTGRITNRLYFLAKNLLH